MSQSKNTKCIGCGRELPKGKKGLCKDCKS